ncbi:DUF4259 domain-containing protein [Streptomyces sp. NPDC054829]
MRGSPCDRRGGRPRGTWGIGPFGKDTAADFAEHLDEATVRERELMIRRALERATAPPAAWTVPMPSAQLPRRRWWPHSTPEACPIALWGEAPPRGRNGGGASGVCVMFLILRFHHRQRSSWSCNGRLAVMNSWPVEAVRNPVGGSGDGC